jgi:hypothetical protein
MLSTSFSLAALYDLENHINALFHSSGFPPPILSVA